MPNIHPVAVHFPIALIFTVVLCDLIGILFKKRSFISAANILMIFAALGAIAAVVSGLLAEDSVWHPGPAHELLETHQTVGLVFLGIVLLLAIFRFVAGERIYGSLGWVALLAGIIGAVVVAYGANLGGEIVYTYGAGVKEAQVATARADSLQNELDLLQGEEAEEEKETVPEGHEGHKHAH